MRQVVAQNLTNLMEAHMPLAGSKHKTLAEAAGVSLSTVQRICNQEVGATIDVLEALASVFHLSVYQLLIPSLDVGNPQVVQGATKEEERLYRQWKQSKLTYQNATPASDKAMGRRRPRVA